MQRRAKRSTETELVLQLSEERMPLGTIRLVIKKYAFVGPGIYSI